MKTVKFIDSSWVREIHRADAEENDKYTFCGALEHRYNQVAYNWNAKTCRSYELDYNNTILPAMEDHNEKTIREYTEEDYNQVIERIKEKGYFEKNVRYEYADSTIRKFEKLIYYVVFQASLYGFCENVLWGSRFAINVESAEEEEIESRVLIKKSLSVQQEKAFKNLVINDVGEDGAEVALLLMLGMGLRNAEACGLNYGDIKLLDNHMDCHVAWIYKTTKIGSNELQSRGKTFNSGRIIPVPGLIVDFLQKRKDLISHIVKRRNRLDIDTDTLPICCDGILDEETENYLNRCRADQVTSAAHEMFEAAGILPKQLAYLDMELSEGNTATILKEKDPSAYLLRRNFATQMHVLGLEYAEMQYLLGHDVEDAYESRNDFVDNDRIYAMHLKLKRRILLNQVTEEYNKTEICIGDRRITKVHILANEPGDNLALALRTEDKRQIKTDIYNEKIDPCYKRTINILKKYQDEYQEH